MAPVVVINGGLEKHVANEGRMKTIKGFEGLLAIYKQLPKVGGFFVNKEFSNERTVIQRSDYYLSESEEEDEDMEDDYDMWLEYPTFKAIIENKLEYHPTASNEDPLETVMYYS